VITAEPLLIPAVGITAVTAATHICLKPHTVAFMISLVEAVLANDASLIFFTVFAFPSNITRLQRFGADPHPFKAASKLSDDISVINVPVQKRIENSSKL
jgi:hypothetical protein